MKKKYIITLTCLCFFLSCNCGIKSNSVNTNHVEETYQVTTQKTNTTRENNQVAIKETSTTDFPIITQSPNPYNIANKDLYDFAYKFVKAIKNRDSILFKELVDEKGFFSVTYFSDGRWPDSIIHVTKDILRSDLVLVSAENKGGITLSVMLTRDLSNLQIQTSSYLDNTNFPVDWSSTNVDAITEKLLDIVRLCWEIIMTNNEDEPQIFVLDNDIYALVRSKGAYSRGLDSGVSIIGHWVIFEKVDDNYFVRAVMDFE